MRRKKFIQDLIPVQLLPEEEENKAMNILYLPNQYSQQRQREKKRFIYPVHLAMEAEWHRQNGDEVSWDTPKISKWDILTMGMPLIIYIQQAYIEKFDKVITEPEGLPFLELPSPDRIFTESFDKKYQSNGNFKYHPGTYIQVANGCWHGKCSFCVERNQKWEVRSVESVIEELEECGRLKFKEVFDDSGTFPIGKWLDDFLMALDSRKLSLKLGCNMRMVDVDYSRMVNVGFRMLLFGLESANQETLDRINKGTKVEDLKYVVNASRAGLDCHLTIMTGFPWESDDDALLTIKLVQKLLKEGIIKTAQASFYQPPDGINNPNHRKYVGQIYDVWKFPRFWITKIRDIHNVDDLKYLWKQIKEGLWNRIGTD
ncbi:radical SAM protein [Patescibacteria group bacterium]|nr:radical SAM protein [Patescibacteria group bacterium]